MKLVLLAVGKTDNVLLSTLINDYIKRINFYISFEMKIVQDVKKKIKVTEKEHKAAEAGNILKSLQPTDYVVLLDENGKQYKSKEFAGYIEKKMSSIPKQLVFIIGGPYGFSEEILKMANEKISLSKMTFTHQMVRLLFTEQIYRAMTIINNEPYHHE